MNTYINKYISITFFFKLLLLDKLIKNNISVFISYYYWTVIIVWQTSCLHLSYATFRFPYGMSWGGITCT